jgi:hypothetical protein
MIMAQGVRHVLIPHGISHNATFRHAENRFASLRMLIVPFRLFTTFLQALQNRGWSEPQLQVR